MESMPEQASPVIRVVTTLIVTVELCPVPMVGALLALMQWGRTGSYLNLTLLVLMGGLTPFEWNGGGVNWGRGIKGRPGREEREGREQEERKEGKL